MPKSKEPGFTQLLANEIPRFDKMVMSKTGKRVMKRKKKKKGY